MGRGYNGSTKIKFEVERYIHNGKLLTGNEEDFPEDAEYTLLELEISGSSYFAPGRLHGHPDNCYPDEGETEIGEILFKGKKWEGSLTDSEEDSVKEQIVEAVTDVDDFVEPDDYDED